MGVRAGNDHALGNFDGVACCSISKWMLPNFHPFRACGRRSPAYLTGVFLLLRSLSRPDSLIEAQVPREPVERSLEIQ